MTKKDYVLIANAIYEAKNSLMYATTFPAETQRSIDIIIETLASKLAFDNPRFDKNKFKAKSTMAV